MNEERARAIMNFELKENLTEEEMRTIIKTLIKWQSINERKIKTITQHLKWFPAHAVAISVVVYTVLDIIRSNFFS